GGLRGCVPIARILRVAEEIAGTGEFEASLFDLFADDLLFNPMNRLRLRNAGTISAAVVDDSVDAAVLEGGEDDRVHLCAVRLHPHGVVIKKNVDDGVELFRLRRKRLVEFAIDSDDVLVDWLCESRR